MTFAFTPDEVEHLQTSLPDVFTKVINELLVKKYQKGLCVIYWAEIVTTLLNEPKEVIVEDNMLDKIQRAYQSTGWTVTIERNEAKITFSKKNKHTLGLDY